MKKISKILAVLLSVCVLVAAAILVVSAEETPIDGTYAVNGTGYDSWADAVEAAGGTETIYLNEDVTVDSQYKISSKVHFDLNSHKIKFTKTDKTSLFDIAADAELVLTGEGSIDGANRFATVAKNAKFTVNALGDGIDIKSSAAVDCVIYVKPGGTAYLSGDIVYTPAKLGGRFLHLGDSVSDLSAIVDSSVTVDALRLTVNEPSNDQRHARTSAMYFAYLYEGAQLTVKNNSVINMIYGNMFSVATTGYANKWYNGVGEGGAHATETTDAPVELTIRIDVDDSKLYANNSGYSVLKHNSYAGLFLGNAFKAFYMTMDNVDIVSCNRTISGVDKRNTYNVASSKIEFNNVNFKSSEGVAYESSWVISERVNIVWNGGTIDLKTGQCAAYNATDPTKDKASVKIAKTADGDPFGAEAIKAAADKGVTISPETHRVVMYDGVNYNGSNILDTWSYHEIYAPKAQSQFAINGIGYAEYVLKDDGSGYRLAAEGETPDAWFGVKISNLAFVTAPSEPGGKIGPNGTVCYAIEGTKIAPVSVPTGLFETETYTVGYFTELPTAAHNLIVKYSGVYNPTTEWNKKVNPSDDTKAVQTGSRVFESIVEAVRDFGTAEHVLGGEGKNGYFKWSVAEGEKADATAPYVEVKLGTYANAAVIEYADGTLTVKNEKSPELPCEDYKYIIHEFDVATDAGVFPNIQSTIITRVTTLISDAEKTVTTKVDQPHYTTRGFNVDKDGKVYSEKSGKDNTSEFTKTNEVIKLPTDGTWSRISFVYEVKGWEDAGTYTVNGVTRPQSKLKIDMHVYINGVWLSTFSDFIKPIDNAFKGTFTLDATRLYPTCKAGSSLLIDNPRLSYYKADDKACADIAKITADPTKTIVDNPEISIMPDNNTYYDATAVGKVDGKEYLYEKDLVNAIEPGSVVELFKDISTVLNVSSNNKLILNGHKYAGYFSETHVGRQYENAVSFLAAKPTEIVTLHFDSSEFGIDDSTHKATLGSTLYLLVAADAPIYNEGLMKTLIGWQTAGGNTVITEADVVGGTVELKPVTSDVKYYYTVSVDGKTTYYLEDEASDIVANVQSVLTEGKTVVVVLWSDIDLTTGTYSIVKNSSLYFDLNGHKYMKTSGGNGFTAASGSHLYLYSSREGGAFVNAQSVVGATTVRVTGSPIWYTNWNENEEHPGMHATFGTVKNDALGIDAAGANLTVMASIIADVRCKEIAQATEANGFTDRNGDGKVDASDIKERATLTIDGGNYIRFTMGGWSMFAACGPLDVNISQANIIGVGAIFSTNSKYHATSMNLTVDNSRVIATSNKFDGTGLEKVFNEFTDDSKASFTNTVIAGMLKPNGGTVTLGAGVALVNPDQLSSSYVKLADGLVMANANYSVTTSTPINYVTYSFTVGGEPQDYDFRDTWGNTTVDGTVSGAVFNKELSVWTTYTDTRNIAGYIDSPEKLAHVTWYDYDKETVIATTYNAPFGDYAIDPELEKSVSIAEGNEWYNVRFTRWTLPTLAAGELAVTPVCETPVANVTCLDLNITLYTNFRLNYYLPVNTEEGFSLKGIASDAEGTVLLSSELVEIDGVSYVMFTEFVSPSDVQDKERYIHFTIGETDFVQYVSFGVEDYVSEILNDDADKYTLEDKIIIANVVRYANEHYKLNVDAAGYGAYNELLDANSAKLVDTSSMSFSNKELDVDKSNLDSIVGNIGFLCGIDRPAFTVVYDKTVYENVILPDAADGGFAAWPENNQGIFTYVHYENYVDYEREFLALQVSVDMSNSFTTGAALENGAWNEDDFVVAMAGDMLVEDLTSVFKIVVYNPDGSVVRGTYSMAAFLNEANASFAEYNCAVSLYALSLAAQEYAAK